MKLTCRAVLVIVAYLFCHNVHAGLSCTTYTKRGIVNTDGVISYNYYTFTDCIRTGFGGGSHAVDGGSHGGGPGGDGLFVENSTAGDANNKSQCAGNPIVVSTGNKIEIETDFRVAEQAGLFLRREYNHYWAGVGIFGKHWISNFDYKLTFGTEAFDSCYPRPGGGSCGIGTNTVIYAHRPDARNIKFIRQADGVFYEDKASPVARIVPQSDGSFVLYGEDQDLERYSSAGYVSSVFSSHGVGWTWSYSGTYPVRVTHTSGRYVDFVWNDGQLTSVRDPAGNYHGYAYHANQFGSGLHRLAATSRPGSPATTVAYHYELSSRPGALTGKSINGARYSTFSYDSNGYATSSEHNGFKKHTFSYTPGSNGLLTVVETNPLGKKTTYTFENGKPRTVTGHPSTYCPASYAETTYDANGYPQLKSDFNGNTTAFQYNAKGQLLEKIEAYGTSVARKTTYTWDAIENRISAVTIGGAAAGSEIVRVLYAYDAKNRITSIRRINLSPTGLTSSEQVTTYGYAEYADGMLQSMFVDGPLPGAGDRTTYNFGADRFLHTVVDGGGNATTYSSYNGLGQPGLAIGPNGSQQAYFYDPRGRVTRARTHLNGGVQDTIYAYDGDGRLASITMPDGVVLKNTYHPNDRDLLFNVSIDSSGVLSGGGTAEQRRIGYTYMGDPSFIAEDAIETRTVWRFRCLMPAGADEMNCAEPDYYEETVTEAVVKRSEAIAYDELGRPRARTGNNGQNVRYGYDLNGNVASVTDSLGRVTRYEYDALDRLVKSIDPLNGVTEFRYDVGDRLTWVRDPRGLVTTYVYDGFGQLWAQHSPDTGTTTFEYNQYGQRTRMNRADGSFLVYQYDEQGRLTYVGSPTIARYYSYDWCTNGRGMLCGMQVNDPQQVLNWTHFGYTPEGRLYVRRDSVYGADDWTGYNYDGMGRLAGISYPSGVSVGYGYSYGKLTVVQATFNGVTHNVATGIKYQPFGPAAEWTYGNGLHRLMNRDLDGRLTAIHTDHYQGLYYGYDANDRITSVVNGRNRHYDQNYGYDALSRLTAVTSPSGNQGFALDATGNRTHHTWLAEEGYGVDAGSNRLNFTALAFSHDGRGNRASQSWGGSTATYGYDDFNRLRTASRDVAIGYTNPNYVYTVYPAGTTSYQVNALDQRVGKSGPLGTSRFVYGGQTQLLAEHTNGAWSSYIWLGGEPIGLVRNNTLHFIHNDHLGRPDIVTDGARNAVWYAANYAFDRQVLHDQIGGLNLGFPGQYYDAETGFWYNGFRDYDGRTGRYLQSDPIGLAGGLNTYAYVMGNPVNYVDPFGLECQLAIGIGATVGGSPILILSPFGSGTVSIGITSRGQGFIKFQGSFTGGIGAFLGVSASLSGGYSRTDTPAGRSVSTSAVAEGNFGAGPTVGGAIGANRDGGSIQTGAGKAGIGAGLQLSGGVSKTLTFATKPLLKNDICGCGSK
jgi:RHS repeat-associated protein